MERTFHLGFVKQGSRLVLEVADTVDGLNPETWMYMGERQVTIAYLQQIRIKLLAAVNKEHGTKFQTLRIQRA